MINVQVVFGAGPNEQAIFDLTLADGATITDAVTASGLTAKYPSLDLSTVAYSVFGHIEREPNARVLKTGERVEVCRPLLVDPKEARRARAEKAKRQRS